MEQYNQNHDRPIVILILDRKLDYADLPAIFGPDWMHYDAHGALRIGLQNPLGVPPDVWIGQLATIFCARAGLIASWATMVNMIRWVVAVMNPKPDDQLLFPDFQLLLDLAEYLPKTMFADKPQYTESFLQALRGHAGAWKPLQNFQWLGRRTRPGQPRTKRGHLYGEPGTTLAQSLHR